MAVVLLTISASQRASADEPAAVSFRTAYRVANVVVDANDQALQRTFTAARVAAMGANTDLEHVAAVRDYVSSRIEIVPPSDLRYRRLVRIYRGRGIPAGELFSAGIATARQAPILMNLVMERHASTQLVTARVAVQNRSAHFAENMRDTERMLVVLDGARTTVDVDARLNGLPLSSMTRRGQILGRATPTEGLVRVRSSARRPPAIRRVPSRPANELSRNIVTVSARRR